MVLVWKHRAHIQDVSVDKSKCRWWRAECIRMSTRIQAMTQATC